MNPPGDPTENARRDLRQRLGRNVFAALELSERARAHWFTLIRRYAFHAFGRGSVLVPPLRLNGPGRIAVGDSVYVGAGCWLQTLGDDPEPALVIGDGSSFAGNCVLSATREIRVGRKVLLARNVYIADHSHAFEDVDVAVLDQGVTRVAPVTIGDGAWLGQNVVVSPGVTIGAGAVVGSNSVVTGDVPPYCVAVGAPAKVVRRLDGRAGSED